MDAASESARHAAQRARGNWTVLLTLLTVAAHGALFGGGLAAVRNRYTQSVPITPSFSSFSMPDATACFGIVIFFAGLCVCPWLVYRTLVSISWRKLEVGPLVAGFLGLLLTGAAATVVALCTTQLMQPAMAWEAPNDDGLVQPDQLRQLLGSLAAAVYVPVTLACAWVTWGLFHADPRITERFLRSAEVEARYRAAAAAAARRPFQPGSLRSAALPLAAAFLLLAACGLATAVLPPIWNPYGGTVAYLQLKSPMNLLANDDDAGWRMPWGPVLTPKLYTDTTVFFVVLAALLALGTVGTYMPAARRVIHRRVKLPWVGNVGASVGELFVACVVLGLIVFWAAYWGTNQRIVGYTQSPAVNPSGYGDEWPWLQIAARTMGHLTNLTMALLMLPVTRNSVWEAAWGIPFDRAIKYHRVLGRLAWTCVTLHMVFWQVKWAKEGTLWNNVVTIDNLIITPCERAGASSCADIPASYHFDNFTIPLVELAWLLLTGALVVANVCRRSRFWLFQVTHIAGAFFLVTAVIHSWSYWYYPAVGIILWVFDKAIRAALAARDVQVLSLSHAAGVTRLVLRSRVLGDKGFYAGQYAWLCVPAISPTQWHPFTISSSPAAGLEPRPGSGLRPGASALAASSGVLTFHIKDMGAGTWTHKLALLATGGVAALSGKPAEGAWDTSAVMPTGEALATGDASAAPAPDFDAQTLAVSLDGPYGRPGHFYERDTVVLVAGGIGVTPFHSILHELHARATAPDVYGPFPANLRRVHLVWTFREAELPLAFAETLAAIAAADCDGLFRLHLHCTSDRETPVPAGAHAPLLAGSPATSGSPVGAGWCSTAAGAAIGKLVQRGRPSLSAIFAAAVAEAKREHAAREGASGGKQGFSAFEAVTAMVCGPDALQAQVSALAFQHGTDFHTEVFAF